MSDLFESLTLEQFMREEQTYVKREGNIGLIAAMLQAGSMLVKYTHDLVQVGVQASLLPDGAVDQQRGRDTMLHAFAFLVVGSALGLKDLAARLKVDETFPEIDVLVSWYRTRWPR